MMKREMRKSDRSCRRGSIYLAVLATSMLVMVVGISALTVARVERRTGQDADDLSEARFFAESAIETGIYLIQADPNWRTTYPNGNWKTNIAFGDGKYSLDVVDPTDASLSDSASEPVQLTGTGYVGNARYILHASATADPTPLEALKKSIAANGDITVNLLKDLTVTGASMATNGKLVNLGTVTGAVETILSSTLGILTGGLTTATTPFALPPATLIDSYIGIATAIPAGDMQSVVLSPASNPWGAANLDGVYYMNAGDTHIRVRDCRILGTLIIRVASGRTVRFDNSNLIQSYRPDYPSIIVDGAAEFTMTSDSLTLSEPSIGVNFNPSGSSYAGAWDADKLDTYPNEIQGLVHVRGNSTFSTYTRIRGALLCEGKVTVSSSCEVIYDSAVYNNKPVGYSTYKMSLSRGSWERVVLP